MRDSLDEMKRTARHTSQPLPMLHPTTSHALSLARNFQRKNLQSSAQARRYCEYLGTLPRSFQRRRHFLRAAGQGCSGLCLHGLTSQRGDSGIRKMIPRRNSSDAIWNAIGNRQMKSNIPSTQISKSSLIRHLSGRGKSSPRPRNDM